MSGSPPGPNSINLTTQNYCYFSDEGIEINGTTNYNCSEICTTPELLFSSDAFKPCLVFGQNRLYLTNDSLDALFTSPTFNDTITDTTNAIDSCMQQYCAHPDTLLGGCPYQNITGALDAVFEDIYNRPKTADQKRFLSRFEATGACNLSETVETVNQDTGGPGVYASYLIQICLALLFGLAVLFSVRRRRQLKDMRRGGADVEDKELIKGELKTLRDLLLDFQVAQCYVTIATDIAFSFALATDGEIFGSTNEYQAQITVTFLAVVANIGSGCVLLNLSTLTLLKAAPLYITVMSFLSVNFGFWLSIYAQASAAYGNFKVNGDIPTFSMCGDQTPATTHCPDFTIAGALDELVDVDTRLYGPALYGLIYSMILFAINLDRSLRALRINWVNKVLRIGSLTQHNASGKWATFWQPLLILRGLILRGLILLGLLPQLAFTGFSMWALVRYKTLQLISHEWNLAQIIAVTIWAPITVRLIYYQECTRLRALSITCVRTDGDIRTVGYESIRSGLESEIGPEIGPHAGPDAESKDAQGDVLPAIIGDGDINSAILENTHGDAHGTAPLDHLRANPLAPVEPLAAESDNAESLPHSSAHPLAQVSIQGTSEDPLIRSYGDVSDSKSVILQDNQRGDSQYAKGESEHRQRVVKKAEGEKGNESTAEALRPIADMSTLPKVTKDASNASPARSYNT